MKRKAAIALSALVAIQMSTSCFAGAYIESGFTANYNGTEAQVNFKTTVDDEGTASVGGDISYTDETGNTQTTSAPEFLRTSGDTVYLNVSGLKDSEALAPYAAMLESVGLTEDWVSVKISDAASGVVSTNDAGNDEVSPELAADFGAVIAPLNPVIENNVITVSLSSDDLSAIAAGMDDLMAKYGGVISGAASSDQSIDITSMCQPLIKAIAAGYARAAENVSQEDAEAQINAMVEQLVAGYTEGLTSGTDITSVSCVDSLAQANLPEFDATLTVDMNAYKGSLSITSGSDVYEITVDPAASPIIAVSQNGEAAGGLTVSANEDGSMVIAIADKDANEIGALTIDVYDAGAAMSATVGGEEVLKAILNTTDTGYALTCEDSTGDTLVFAVDLQYTDTDASYDIMIATEPAEGPGASIDFYTTVSESTVEPIEVPTGVDILDVVENISYSFFSAYVSGAAAVQ